MYFNGIIDGIYRVRLTRKSFQIVYLEIHLWGGYDFCAKQGIACQKRFFDSEPSARKPLRVRVNEKSEILF